MKNTVLYIFAIVFLTSCQEKKAELVDINLLNGYWEIENVTLSDGSVKTYKMNETIDYISVKKDSGFRKKVKPQFDGSYVVNDVDEKFSIVKSSEGTFIKYETEFTKWQEKIESLTNEQLILVNDQKIKYQYKHPTPFTVK